MGTQETDWVTIANNLLYKCHINLQVRDLKSCDAHVFVSLYENILGEKVPDFIADSQSPEDDAHNVQSVIDSLALDYLQVSLSHITGENIVRGDIESIKNLLEIFDGLLEYLTEQISEASSQNGDDMENYKEFNLRRQQEENTKEHKDVLPSSTGSLSFDNIAISWEVDGSESTAELIRLGDTAHTFTVRGSDLERLRQRDERSITLQPAKIVNDPRASISPPSISTYKEPIHCQARTQTPEHPPAAIPLNRPYQPKASRPLAVSRDVQASVGGESLVRSKKPPPDINNDPDITSSASEESKPLKSLASRSLAEVGHDIATEVPSLHLGQKKVAFHTEPDVRLMTLQSTLGEHGDWALTSEEGKSAQPNSPTLQLTDEHPSRGSEYSLINSRSSDPPSLPLVEEPISVQRARNKLSELELQDMSKRLSRRLDELDRMLKKVVQGEHSTISEAKEEDKLSHHSDSIIEFRRKKRLHAAQHPKKNLTRPRSLSSSPLPPPHQSLSTQFEDALCKNTRGDMGKIRRDVQKEAELQRLKSQMLSNAYEEELKAFGETEWSKLSKLKEKIKENEQEFKENIFKKPQKKSYEKVYAVQTPKPKQWTPNCNKLSERMKVKENDLLPLLLEEFPHLQISPHTLTTMWKEQLAQVEQLARASQEDNRSERKLHKEVEEAHKKHGLLVDIIQREQGHNQRLKDFKERIRLQKSAHSKMRENRQQVARAKRYYEDYHVQLRAKFMRSRTREERIFKKLFEEGLALQKQRLRELRSYTKEQREEQRKRHKDELESMENYYKDQFSMLAEAVTQERQEIQAREQVQSKTLHKMKRELRAKMEKEIQELQEMIIKTDEDAYFRELEAERLKKRLQMASFQYSKSHCL
ncbi:centrosomal protein of 95 kDa isoform X2 [Pseudophryne corroboree]|uniref:centrosomal protein of 95 kDa isoform X2 n=1 Tax=Pseudophryne corroboree TaxID=495146 RepID=UPI003081B9E8